jgi:hypothetical protein
MHRLAPILLALATITHAQAPIERRTPPTYTPTANTSWQKIQKFSSNGWDPELRVQALGDPIRCDLRDITPTTLICIDHQTINSPIRNIFIPPQAYVIPRADIREIRIGGRDKATALGMLIGLGVGVGIGSINHNTGGTSQFIGASIFGLVGALIGHHAPFKGRILYRNP